MGIKQWVSKISIGLSCPKYRKRGDLMIESDDDMEADVIAECYRTKKPIFMSREAGVKSNKGEMK